MENRKDPKGRVLRAGEMWQESRKRYRFRYKEDGKTKDVYSFRLTDKDPIPKGMVQCESLRSKEKKIFQSLDRNENFKEGNISVLELCERFEDYQIQMKIVKDTTLKGYRTAINFLKTEDFGSKNVRDISKGDAKVYLRTLQQTKKKNYSSCCSLKSFLKSAFKYGIDKRWISDNAFDFTNMGILENDTIKKDAISQRDVRRLLKYVKEYYSESYGLFYFAFYTGMRAGEIAGICEDDIQWNNNLIEVNKQLTKKYTGNGKGVFEIETTKTVNGVRSVPMGEALKEVIRNQIEENRKNGFDSYSVDGYSKFLFMDSKGEPMTAEKIAKKFQSVRIQFNKLYKEELPDNLTPHTARHTYITMLINNKVSAVRVAQIVGHADISTTINIYHSMGSEPFPDDLKGDISEMLDGQSNEVPDED